MGRTERGGAVALAAALLSGCGNPVILKASIANGGVRYATDDPATCITSLLVYGDGAEALWEASAPEGKRCIAQPIAHGNAVETPKGAPHAPLVAGNRYQLQGFTKDGRKVWGNFSYAADGNSVHNNPRSAD